MSCGLAFWKVMDGAAEAVVAARRTARVAWSEGIVLSRSGAVCVCVCFSKGGFWVWAVTDAVGGF